MAQYFHSVTLDKERCKGCTNCIKRCPTEAIRVRAGKAKIINERCIDCGECIRVCPYHAKKAITDPFDVIFSFKYKVALPAPSLYGQFKNIYDINVILTGLKRLGFDDVFEVAKAAEVVTLATKHLIAGNKVQKPAISSACPVIIRLIEVKYPNLIDNVVPIKSPMEVAARMAKRIISKNTGLPQKEIGVFFITPCAAKMTSTKAPMGSDCSFVDGVISMSEVYYKMIHDINKITHPENLSTAGMKGISWAKSGGESFALGDERAIAVDGIHNVIKVLEEMEDDKISDIDYVELQACTGGCVGGPLTVENNFIAKNRIMRIARMAPNIDLVTRFDDLCNWDISWTNPITYKPILNLDNDMVKAMQKMKEMENIYNSLPGLDCGSCGAPSCRALAEDIVRGFATETDCIFKLREQVRMLAREMMELEGRMPPPFRKDE
ncbi:MAG: 4Fe-4S binding protein [Clostridiaceae bacterium]|nr:4Fe-4S binding protein [Clostridiaceae bacterium]